jgi:hypothetical protein
MRRLYAAALRYIDDWTARMIESLARAGLAEQTQVIVCSDHGENFGEGGLITHGLSLDERLLRVPFIVAGPGHGEFAGLRSLAELPARVGRVAQLERTPWESGLVAGLPVAQWDPFELAPSRLADLTAQWHLDEEGVRRLTSPLTCAVSGQFKLVRGAEESDEALYDLSRDPLELAPLRGEQMLARAGGVLVSLRAAVSDPRAQARASSGLRPDEASPDEVAEIERRMRLLGYM